MLENVMVTGFILCMVAPFILGWVFKSKMGMSWIKSIFFAICYPISLCLIGFGVTGCLEEFNIPELRVPIIVSCILIFIALGISTVLIIKKMHTRRERFDYFSYMFFLFPIMSILIHFAVFLVSVLLSYAGYIGPELKDFVQ